MAYLFNIDNPEVIFELPEMFSVGRDETCHLQLDGQKVADRHCRIEKKTEGYLLRDLRSGFGTRVNGRIILEKFMSDGDEIDVDNQIYLFTEHAPRKGDLGLYSKNPRWSEQLRVLAKVATTQYPVLLLGPSGTGKEVVAQALHEHSERKDGEFIGVNCSALTETLIESELFGHLKGSFTGAVSDRKGAFEAARGGTLFLDEIGDLPYCMQAKLLRALENDEIRPVGSDRVVKTNVRIIAATHQDLQDRIRRKEFRSDLYFRLNVVTTYLPSLSERMEDFEDLVETFGKKYKVRFTADAIQKMKEHSWPGNIRELRNSVARASAYFPHTRIDAKFVPMILDLQTSQSWGNREISDLILSPLDLSERAMIVNGLKTNRGNQRQTAKDLGFAKSTLHDKIQNYQIQIDEFRS